jgi:hypothetical protein
MLLLAPPLNCEQLTALTGKSAGKLSPETCVSGRPTEPRKCAREVDLIHNNNARKPPVLFNALARAIFYKGCDEIDDPSLTNSIHMHYDRVFAAKSPDACNSIASVLSATAKAQAAENGLQSPAVLTSRRVLCPLSCSHKPSTLPLQICSHERRSSLLPRLLPPTAAYAAPATPLARLLTPSSK